jgi:CubicO group peptidase (beta-lactamase class C family)
MGPAVAVDGWCEPGFEAVRDAFRDNFTQHDEVGAAVSVYAAGRVVVDLWGGWTSTARDRQWDADTLVNVFSIGKGVTAVGVLRCVASGLLDLDAPVARYWAEFGAGGKAGITLRQVLCHQAGLPAVREKLPRGAALDWSRMVAALAAQEPWWEPGSAHGYHVNTFGYLVGEAVRRVTGASLGSLLAEQVCGPLGADVYLGLPDSEHHRVATFDFPEDVGTVPDAELTGVWLMRAHAYGNPPDVSGAGVINSAAWRRAELPSTNMHASARGVARLYAALAGGGVLDGVRVADAGLLREASREHSAGPDLVLDRPSRFALGFQLSQPERPLGPDPDAFGHFGAGGSLGFCDPAAGIGFGYVMNQLGPRWQNPRNRALVDALYRCV